MYEAANTRLLGIGEVEAAIDGQRLLPHLRGGIDPAQLPANLAQRGEPALIELGQLRGGRYRRLWPAIRRLRVLRYVGWRLAIGAALGEALTPAIGWWTRDLSHQAEYRAYPKRVAAAPPRAPPVHSAGSVAIA